MRRSAQAATLVTWVAATFFAGIGVAAAAHAEPASPNPPGYAHGCRVAPNSHAHAPCLTDDTTSHSQLAVDVVPTDVVDAPPIGTVERSTGPAAVASALTATPMAIPTATPDATPAAVPTPSRVPLAHPISTPNPVAPLLSTVPVPVPVPVPHAIPIATPPAVPQAIPLPASTTSIAAVPLRLPYAMPVVSPTATPAQVDRTYDADAVTARPASEMSADHIRAGSPVNAQLASTGAGFPPILVAAVAGATIALGAVLARVGVAGRHR